MSDINYGIIVFSGFAKTHALDSNAANLIFNLPFNLNSTDIVTRKPTSGLPYGKYC